MTLLDAAYVNRQTALQLTARVAEGWSKKTKTYGYCESVRLEFKEGYWIRVQLRVFPRPGGFHDSVHVFKPSWHFANDEPGVNCRLLHGVLTVTIQFLGKDGSYNLNLPWRQTSNKKLAIYFTEPSFVAEEYTNFELQLQVVFNSPGKGAPPDVREAGETFFPGGLPTLGKRR